MASALQIATNLGVKTIAKIRTGFYPGFGQYAVTPAQEAAQIVGLAPDPLAQFELAKPGLGGALGQTLLKTAFGLGVAAVPGGMILDKVIPVVATKETATQGGPMPATFDPTAAFQNLDPYAPGAVGNNSFDLGGIFSSLPTVSEIGSSISGFFGGGTSTPNSPAPPSPVSYSGGALAIPAMAAVPMISRVAGGGLRSLFARFPNLAAGMNALRMAGKNVSRSKLYSLAKSYGPGFLVTSGILSAQAVSELIMAGPGRRRMNPANVKALRRAHRRMASFHHICRKNDALMHRGGRRKAVRVGASNITTVRG